MLHPTDTMILFFRKNWFHVATMVGVYETRVKSSDDGLTDLKRGIGQAPRKLVNANQSGRNKTLQFKKRQDCKKHYKCTEVTQ